MNITHCRSCKSKKITSILSLGELSLSHFIRSDEKKDGTTFPLDLVLCKECSLLQLKASTPPSLLYTDNYGYRSGINNTMKKELKAITARAQKLLPLLKNDIVIDIGSNDGTLLKTYQTDGILRVGFDPVSKFGKAYIEPGEYFINSYFNSSMFKKKFGEKKAKIITAISMFYDLEDPNSFVADVKRVLDLSGIFVIQQNYLGSMLRLNAFDNIVHEHIEYYSLLSLEILLARHDLFVFDVIENDTNGGSFRTCIAHNNSGRKVSKRVVQMRALENQLKLFTRTPYIEFAGRIKNIKKNLSHFISQEVKKGKKVYVYGASTRGNTILQYCHLDNQCIPFAIERNPEKFGQKIASVGIPIISEEQARRMQPDYFLVLPWFFKDEIVQREKSYLQKGGKLIFPLPQITLIESYK